MITALRIFLTLSVYIILGERKSISKLKYIKYHLRITMGQKSIICTESKNTFSIFKDKIMKTFVAKIAFRYVKYY